VASKERKTMKITDLFILFILGLVCVVQCEDHSSHDKGNGEKDMYWQPPADTICSPHSQSCDACASIKGCAYCSKGMAVAFCTNVTDIHKANCDASSCANDRFV
jgi:hypothetical protein